MPPRPVLSDEEERADREDRTRLRTLDSKLEQLHRHRQELVAEMRRLTAEQKDLYDRRQAPQVEVEKLYEEHGELGKRFAEVRRQRDAARRAVDEAVIRLRELRLTFAPGERLRPDQLKREIAQLEMRQQTHALSLDEENALIATLRQRTKDLKEAEARTQVVAEHERQRKEAESAVAAARAELDRLGHEMLEVRAQREAKMTEVRSKLEAAGGLVADLRAKGRARAEVLAELDRISHDILELEREGRRTLGQMRARRDEARKTLRTYTRRPTTPQEVADSRADAQLEELLKRGRISLGG